MSRVLVLAVLAACGDSPAAPTVDAPRPIDAGPPPGFPATLTIPASHGTLAHTFSATITGAGTGTAARLAPHAHLPPPWQLGR